MPSRTLPQALLLLMGGAIVSSLTHDGLAAGPKQPSVQHVVVYSEPGKFCGFPANSGAWSWGNEVLVGFNLGGYQEKERGHSTDRSVPSECVLARSLNAGQTWTLEKPKGLRAERDPQPFHGHVNFTHPDFALRCPGVGFQFSYDRGKTWSEIYELPKGGSRRLLARTDYLVNGKDDCLLFLAAAKTNGREGRPFCVRTTDGGNTMKFVAWMMPEPEGFAIMPSTVRTGSRQLVSAIRRKEDRYGFIEIYASSDDGQSWRRISRAADTGVNNGNPPSMVRLKDGRLVLTYGYRSPPMGIRARISLNGGLTWGDEIHLRDDGRTWDLGYPRTIALPDGKVLTIYYFTTLDRQPQHIAATIWKP